MVEMRGIEPLSETPINYETFYTIDIILNFVYTPKFNLVSGVFRSRAVSVDTASTTCSLEEAGNLFGGFG